MAEAAGLGALCTGEEAVDLGAVCAEAEEAGLEALCTGEEAVDLGAVCAEAEETDLEALCCAGVDAALPAGAASGTAAVLGFGTLIIVSVLLPDPPPPPLI